MAEKTNKLTIGLVKSSFNNFDDIIIQAHAQVEIANIGTFYAESRNPQRPSWITEFFGDTLDALQDIKTASAKGVLLVRLGEPGAERIFAVIFGHGRLLLRDGVLEERFGLKVVLNSVDPDSLRSIDKTALGSIPKQSREQISREGAAANFGIDIEQDLISSITGKSRIPRFGRTISGRDTFSASAKFDVHDVRDFLAHALDRYNAEDYVERFDWVDHIADVRSKPAIARLDAQLIERLRTQQLDNIWMVPPEVIDWADAVGFKFLRKRSQLFQDLDTADLINASGDAPIDVEWLTNSSILLISARNDDVIDKWSAYKCIYAEIQIDGEMHILNAGKWYRVASDFTELVNANFAATPDSNIVLPDYNHENEAAYNLAVKESLAGSHCMDADVIIHGGGQSKIEFCDVLTSNKELLHVKRYSGSAQLSHLFSQGVTSAELFIGDSEFRRKLNEKLPMEHRLGDVLVRPNPQEYEIVFTIVSKSANPLNLPFFSKVTLKNARRRLEAYGFRVSKKKVRAIGNEPDRAA